MRPVLVVALAGKRDGRLQWLVIKSTEYKGRRRDHF